MKKLLLFFAMLFACVYSHAQEPAHQMAFYGVNSDTASQRDTIFRLDSSHVTIYGALAIATNTAINGLTSQLYQPSPNLPIESASYISTKPGIGGIFNLGFEYVTKLHRKKHFWSFGLELTFAYIQGNINSTINTRLYNKYGLDSTVASTGNVAYSGIAMGFAAPIKAYFVLSETARKRMSLGAGLTFGYSFINSIDANGYSSVDFLSPINMVNISLRIDKVIKRKAGLSLEPFFAFQIFDQTTHTMCLGLKMASL